jgi:hypothetical protein
MFGGQGPPASIDMIIKISADYLERPKVFLPNLLNRMAARPTLGPPGDSLDDF